MDRHLKAYLYDISTAIDEIYSFFETTPKRFDEYKSNLMLRRASLLHFAVLRSE